MALFSMGESRKPPVRLPVLALLARLPRPPSTAEEEEEEEEEEEGGTGGRTDGLERVSSALSTRERVRCWRRWLRPAVEESTLFAHGGLCMLDRTGC